ncbi:hypothetical protein IAT40_000757 [Kwoniella sp. CBS 6097]
MEGLLSDQSILLAEGQFSEIVLELLKEKVMALGATLTTQREESTILLVNPSHPKYAKEKEHIAYLTKNYPQVAQPDVYPYHWLTCCAQAGRLLKLDELALVSPIFTYPASSEDWRPLRVWVSVNLAREDGEKPEEARDNCTAQLEAGGALSVSKRALADVLVVDETSNFAKKVHAEKKAHGRDWQRIVERDWVDGCLRSKTLAWRSIVASADAADDGQDSMAEEDMPIGQGKGLGRPTGKPRTEYTPQDDDFLCRWLAAHHPHGSWSSRKTYVGLVDQSAQFTFADRHTAQSWHERFKKNAATFERRIKRLIQDGVNDTLKTKAERLKLREMKALKEKENETQAGTADRVESRAVQPEAGPSRSQALPPQAASSVPVSASAHALPSAPEQEPEPSQRLASGSTSAPVSGTTLPAKSASASASASAPDPASKQQQSSTHLTPIPSTSTESAKRVEIDSTATNEPPAGQPEFPSKPLSPGPTTVPLGSEDRQDGTSIVAAPAASTPLNVSASRSELDQNPAGSSPAPLNNDIEARPNDIAGGSQISSAANTTTLEPTVEPATTTDRPSDQPVITITEPTTTSAEAIPADTDTDVEPSQPASQAGLESGESLSDLLPSPSQFEAFVNPDPASQPSNLRDKQKELVGDPSMDTDLAERELIEGQLKIDEESLSTSGPLDRRTKSRSEVITPAETSNAEPTNKDVGMASEERGKGNDTKAISSATAEPQVQAQAQAQADVEMEVDASAEDDLRMQVRSPGRPRKSVRLDDDVQVSLIRTSQPVHPNSQSSAHTIPSTPASGSALADAGEGQEDSLYNKHDEVLAQDISPVEAQPAAHAPLPDPASATSLAGQQNPPESIVDNPATSSTALQTPTTAKNNNDNQRYISRPFAVNAAAGPSRSSAAAAVTDAATPTSDVDRGATPINQGQGRKKRPRPSTLREHLESASKSKSRRRSTLDRSGRHGYDTFSANEADLEIETVYADVSLPPRPVRQTPLHNTTTTATPTPKPTSSVRKPDPVPVLSAVQRAESVDRGRNIVLDQAREYKERLGALSKKFGLTPSEVVAFMTKNKSRSSALKGIGNNNNGQSRSSANGPWEEVERGLQLHYGGGRRGV